MKNDMKTGREMEADILAGLPRQTVTVELTKEEVEKAGKILSRWHSRPSNIFKKEPAWLPIIRAVALRG